MADFKLNASYALNGKTYDYPGFHIHELTNNTLWSLANSAQKIPLASACLEQHLGLNWPDIGHSTTGNKARCLGLQTEQVFLMMDATDKPLDSLMTELCAAMVVTDQSDSWVILELSGERSLEVLERICPIDLHPDLFTDGRVARTVMEHLSVIIVRHDKQFVLLSARSSADSFVHALTQSAEFVL